MAAPDSLSSATLSATSTTLLASMLTRARTTTSPGSAPTQTLLVNLDELQGGISNRAAYYSSEAMHTLSSRSTHHSSPSNAGPSSPRQRASPCGAGAAAASARASPSPSGREHGMGGSSSSSSSALPSGSPRTARALQLELPAASSDAAAAAADPFLSDPILKPEGASAAAAAVSEAAAASTLPASPATPRGGGAGTRAALQATVESMEAELAALKLQLAASS